MSTIGTVKAGSHGSLARKASGRGMRVALLVASLGAALNWLDARLERQRSRRLLGYMTDDQLKDIGISRADAYRETHRKLWD